MELLVVDAANVVGSRPDGWWRDRAGAARRLHDRITAADWGDDEVVLVVEGGAKRGLAPGRDGSVCTVHADGSGDDAIVEEVVRQVAAHAASREDRQVVVVTADRELRDRVEAAGATTRSPRWLLDRL
jgi:hypothetical protein